MRPMPRFRVTNLLVLTAVAALYSLALRVVFQGYAPFAWAGWVALIGLVSWSFYSQSKVDVAMMRERDDQEKRAD